MQKRDTLSSYHPLVAFLYFGLVLALAMCFMHPVCLGISLVSALAYSLSLGGGRAMRLSLFYMLPMMLLAAVINPAFNHEGATILRYLPSGNPLTLESIAYGAASAVMLWAVITWFGCFSQVMTSDKLIYLFGRVIPALSLVLSMTLRFVPRYKRQIKAVSAARRLLGREASDGAIRRIKNAVTILSVMVTWSMENAIETADSMKSRGYGLPGRTAFSVCRLGGRDMAALVWLLACGLFVISGWAVGGVYFRWYPTIKGPGPGPFSFSFMLAYLALCLTPVILNVKEAGAWKRTQSAA